MFPYMVFFLSFMNFFFQNDLCRFYFFHIELIENFASCFFKKTTLWIAKMFPYMVFVLLQCLHTCFFFKIIFVEFFFLILNWLRI